MIDAWAGALLEGDVVGASTFFARGALVQNGTPVLRLTTRRARVVFNLSLPCGAQPVRYGSGDGYTIVEFVLRERPGGDCGGAVGQRARCAIKVDDGRITGWYRLPDAAGGAVPPRGRSPEIESGTSREA